MSEPIYQTLLGLYLTLEDFRKAVKPGQRVNIWIPPTFEVVEGTIGQVLGSNPDEPRLIARVDSGGLVVLTEDNVHLFQPIHKRKRRETATPDPAT